jgi:hypothetical protein
MSIYPALIKHSIPLSPCTAINWTSISIGRTFCALRNQTELSKLQRMACLGITGVMRMNKANQSSPGTSSTAFAARSGGQSRNLRTRLKWPIQRVLYMHAWLRAWKENLSYRWYRWWYWDILLINLSQSCFLTNVNEKTVLGPIEKEG